jgi:hypothetical protein
MQNYGIDYLETYAPVVRFETLRAAFTLAMTFNYDVQQIDFDTAFLNATLPNEYKIFMKQPEGFVHPDFPGFVCLLKKSLYGLKQAPKEWNSMLHQYLKENGFNRNWKDYGLYWKIEEMEIILILVYVDDVLIIGPINMVKEFIDKLKSIFKVKELGRVSKLLGMEVQYSLEETIITQKKYTESILRRFKMEEANPASTPMEIKLKLEKLEKETPSMYPYRSAVGSLQYLVTGSRPDLAFSTNFFSRFSAGYGQIHWNHLKRVLRYLKGSMENCLRLDGANARDWLDDEHFVIEVFADADYNNGTDGKSVTGFATFLNGQFVSGRSWRQSKVTESTAEAELVAANEAVRDGIWLKQLLESMNLFVQPVVLYVDNKSTLQIASHPTSHRRTKHLEITLLKIREYVESKEVELFYISSEENIADMFTKSLGKTKLDYFIKKMGMRTTSTSNSELQGSMRSANSE